MQQNLQIPFSIDVAFPDVQGANTTGANANFRTER